MNLLRSVRALFNLAGKGSRAGATHKEVLFFYKNIEQNHAKAVIRFLKKYPDYLNKTRIFDQSAPLHIAATYGAAGVTEALLNQGADVSCLTGRGETALHRAAWCLHPEIVDLLLSHAADPAAKTIAGETPRDQAFFHQNRILPVRSGLSSYEREIAIADGERAKKIIKAFDDAALKKERMAESENERYRRKTEDILTYGVVPDARLRLRIKLKRPAKK